MHGTPAGHIAGQLTRVDWQPGSRVAEISWAQRGTLMGLISRYLHTSEERYLRLAERMVDGLLRAAVHCPDGLLFPEGYYRPDGWRYHEPNLHPCLEEYNAAVALPALRLYPARAPPSASSGASCCRSPSRQSPWWRSYGFKPPGPICWDR